MHESIMRTQRYPWHQNISRFKLLIRIALEIKETSDGVSRYSPYFQHHRRPFHFMGRRIRFAMRMPALTALA